MFKKEEEEEEVRSELGIRRADSSGRGGGDRTTKTEIHPLSYFNPRTRPMPKIVQCSRLQR